MISYLSITAKNRRLAYYLKKYYVKQYHYITVIAYDTLLSHYVVCIYIYTHIVLHV